MTFPPGDIVFLWGIDEARARPGMDGEIASCSKSVQRVVCEGAVVFKAHARSGPRCLFLTFESFQPLLLLPMGFGL